jgi:hypothetical protein
MTIAAKNGAANSLKFIERNDQSSGEKPNDHQRQGDADTYRTTYHHRDC